MKLAYTVHGARMTTVVVPVTYDGQTVDATVPAYVAELVPDGHACGTIKVVTTKDIKDATALFAEGKSLTVTIEEAN